MTTTVSGRRQTTACNGVTTAFPVNFQFEANGELFVYLGNASAFDPDADTLLTEGVDYTISGSGPAKTAVVTTTTAYPTGKYLTRYRVTSRAQSADFVAGDGIGADKLETALDRLALVNEEQDEGLTELGGRAVRVPAGETIAELPAAASRGSSVMGFDALGAFLLRSASQLAAFVAPYLPANLKGDPGGNALAVGLFTAVASLSIAAGTDVIETSGHGVLGKGKARYVADAAVDAAFVAANPKWAVRTSNGRGFRLDDEPWFTPIEAFGAVGDATGANVGTDDDPAVIAAKAWMDYFRFAPSSNTDYKPTPQVYFQRRGYRSVTGNSSAWLLANSGYQFAGGGNNINGYGGTWIFVDAGKGGAVIQCWDNTGTALTETHTTHTYGTDPRGAQNTRLADLTFISRGGTVGAADQNGVLSHTACTLERVHVFDFGGHGIAMRADAGSGTNANGALVTWCGAQRCGLSGYYGQGGDVNATPVAGFQAFNNRQFGIYGAAFLLQTYPDFQCDGNGTTTSGPSWATKGISSFTNYGGHIWYVRPGKHVLASTTTPGTDATVWIDQGAGATSLGGSWVSGQSFTSGGGFYTGAANFVPDNNGHHVFAGYCESNQYIGWGDNSSACSMPGFAQFSGGSSCFLQNINSAFVSAAIGYRGACANGDVIQFLLGLPGANDGAFWTFGRGASGETPWRALCDASNNVSYSYNGGGSTSPIDFVTGGNHPFSASMANGAALGGVYFTGRTAVPTTGTWNRGDIVKNSAPSVGQPRGWVCTVAGTPGTWVSEGNL